MGDSSRLARHPLKPSAGTDTLGNTRLMAHARPGPVYPYAATVAPGQLERPHWSAYSQPRRPERPVPICRYPALDAIVAERTLRYGDGHDAKIYTWEATVEQTYGLDREPLLTAADGQGYVDKIWRIYSPGLSPFFSATPTLVLVTGAELRGAVANCLCHEIRINAEHCRRSWLIHETIHLCIPEEQHGERWLNAMIKVWRHEFMIAPAFSRELAREAGLEMVRRRKGQPFQLSLMLGARVSQART